MYAIQITLLVLICATSLLSLVYSIRSRRSQDQVKRGLFAARTNICMGFMLIFISIIQMTMFPTTGTLRIVFGGILLAIGVFNLVAGLRNHSYFARLQQSN
ncbi:YtpI family protein [Paenibacillus agilis]|uniref:YtpI-like protein n=1 Tax=Paenibacillus agilis TaxID=3020863 RepID=A0A559IXF9_9BACL|nr:YtpI family protein [Paenibacillus agilis]TVX92324.1 hypothetical protein FPZ44_04145 [Paenibacillus agilis]